ncbi:MAG: ABC transporter ATP-binding protein [Desulfovibrio sp.]|nr:MAG: ABC transporter ATP-binding protein [Desulfovibrio sp.]
MDCRVIGLSKSLGGKPVLDNVGFSAGSGELVSIIGPSGVGKTTLLMILAGLESADSGAIEYDPQPSKDQPAILVFQDYLLFPNLTVFENTAFGLRARKLPRKEIKDRVSHILGYFHLQDKMRSYPNQLSAGQKQRVAIARAMVVNPGLLLLDEPFANLDRNLKLETAEFIRATQQEFGITTISVTHDLTEAFVMSDKIGIMLGGKLVQFGPAGEVYSEPATFEAAKFLGPVNVITPSLCRALNLAEAPIPDNCGTMYSRPEAVRIQADPQGVGVISQVNFAGHYICYTVAVEQDTLLVYSLHDGYSPGDRVDIQILKYLTSQRDQS